MNNYKKSKIKIIYNLHIKNNKSNLIQILDKIKYLQLYQLYLLALLYRLPM